MRGAKPKPTALRLVTGNPGRRPLNSQEAKTQVKVPAPPKMLKGEGLREWKRVTKLLAEVGLITKLDRGVVAAYCQAWARWLECERELESAGLMVATPNGYQIISPYLSAANKAMDQMRQMSEQIGLSGSARSRIKASEPPSREDPAEAFLRGRA